jgi:hypothetical protein
MRLIGVFTVVAGLGSACVPGNSPIHITELWATDSSCKFDDMVGKTRGTLDASGAGTYLIGMDISSDLAKGSQIDSTGMEVGSPSINTFVVEFLAVTYTAKDAMSGATVGGAFAPENLPVTFQVAPLTDKNQLITEIIGPKAAAQLAGVVTNPAQNVIFTVSMTLKGHLEAGGALSSDTVSYPITVTTSGANCANGFQKTGPCMTGGGQDGTAVTCL